MKKKRRFKYGDFIYLKPNAKVLNSLTGEELSYDIVKEPELWTVDHYEPSLKILNISRVLRPYPGAYCSWVNEKHIIPTDTGIIGSSEKEKGKGE